MDDDRLGYTMVEKLDQIQNTAQIMHIFWDFQINARRLRFRGCEQKEGL